MNSKTEIALFLLAIITCFLLGCAFEIDRTGIPTDSPYFPHFVSAMQTIAKIWFGMSAFAFSMFLWHILTERKKGNIEHSI